MRTRSKSPSRNISTAASPSAAVSGSSEMPRSWAHDALARLVGIVHHEHAQGGIHGHRAAGARRFARRVGLAACQRHGLVAPEQPIDASEQRLARAQERSARSPPAPGSARSRAAGRPCRARCGSGSGTPGPARPRAPSVRARNRRRARRRRAARGSGGRARHRGACCGSGCRRSSGPSPDGPGRPPPAAVRPPPPRRSC